MKVNDAQFKQNLKSLKKFKINDNVYLITNKGLATETVEFGYISGMQSNCHNDIVFEITIPKYNTELYNSFSHKVYLHPDSTMTIMCKI